MSLIYQLRYFLLPANADSKSQKSVCHVVFPVDSRIKPVVLFDSTLLRFSNMESKFKMNHVFVQRLDEVLIM